MIKMRGACHGGLASRPALSCSLPCVLTECGSARSSISPVGTEKTPPLTPPSPRKAPNAALSHPTRFASSGRMGPLRLMKSPLLNEPKA